MKIALITALFILAAAQNFDILSTSTCVNVSTIGYCLKWSQNGTINQQLGSCFPADALVMTPQGLKNMGFINKGDMILGLVDGQEKFTQVTSWFHHNPKIESEFLNIEVEGKSNFQVSAKHNIATAQKDYIFAEDAQNANLHGAGKVSSMEKVVKTGIYSPKTKSNNYFVYTSNSQSKVLAHCFAHIKNPERYEMAVDAIQRAWDMLGSSEDLEHPSFEWMKNTFSFLADFSQ